MTSTQTELSAIDVMKARGSMKKYQRGVEIPKNDLEADKNAEGVYKPALEAGHITQQVYDILLGQIKGA